MLAEGMRDASSPFHTLALATIADDGPEVRTVVLRRVLREKREISCHTDWRSPRRVQIETHSIVSWLLHDRARKLQLRVRGWAYLHHNTDVTRERWERIAPHSRRCHASPLAPGARLTVRSRHQRTSTAAGAISACSTAACTPWTGCFFEQRAIGA